MNKKITVYEDGEHEVLNIGTGEIHHSDQDNIV